MGYLDQVQTARKEGYSDEEIMAHLGGVQPKIMDAVKEGYSLDEVVSFLDGVPKLDTPNVPQPKPQQIRQDDIINTIDKHSQSYGIDPTLMLAVAEQESGVTAINPETGKWIESSAGAIGPMQVLRSNFKRNGIDTKTVNLDQLVEMGVRIYNEGLQRYGDDPRMAALYYHSGNSHGKTDKVYKELQETGKLNIPFSPEFYDGAKYSADYVTDVMGRWDKYNKGNVQAVAEPQEEQVEQPTEPNQVQGVFEAIKTGGAQAAKYLAETFSRIAGATLAMDEMSTGHGDSAKALKYLSMVDKQWASTAKAIQETIPEHAVKAQQETSNYLLSQEAWTNPKNYIKTAHALASVAASQAPQMAMSAIPVAGEMSIIATEMGNWAEQAKQKGLSDATINKWMWAYGVPSGVIETEMNKVLLGLNKVPGISTVAKKISSKASKILTSKLMRTIGGALGEGSEETTQAEASDLVMYAALKDEVNSIKDKAKSEELNKQAEQINLSPFEKSKIQAGVIGTLVGGIYKGGSVLLTKDQNTTQPQKDIKKDNAKTEIPQQPQQRAVADMPFGSFETAQEYVDQSPNPEPYDETLTPEELVEVNKLRAFKTIEKDGLVGKQHIEPKPTEEELAKLSQEPLPVAKEENGKVVIPEGVEVVQPGPRYQPTEEELAKLPTPQSNEEPVVEAVSVPPRTVDMAGTVGSPKQQDVTLPPQEAPQSKVGVLVNKNTGWTKEEQLAKSDRVVDKNIKAIIKAVDSKDYDTVIDLYDKNLRVGGSMRSAFDALDVDADEIEQGITVQSKKDKYMQMLQDDIVVNGLPSRATRRNRSENSVDPLQDRLRELKDSGGLPYDETLDEQLYKQGKIERDNVGNDVYSYVTQKGLKEKGVTAGANIGHIEDAATKNQKSIENKLGLDADTILDQMEDERNNETDINDEPIDINHDGEIDEDTRESKKFAITATNNVIDPQEVSNAVSAASGIIHKRLPTKLQKRTRIIKTFQPKANWYGKVVPSNDGSFNVYFNTSMPLDKVVPTVFEELVAHVGIKELSKSDTKTNRELNKIFNSIRNSKYVDDIATKYETEIAQTDEGYREEHLMDETLAHIAADASTKLFNADYTVNEEAMKDKNSIHVRVYNAIKNFVQRIYNKITGKGLTDIDATNLARKMLSKIQNKTQSNAEQMDLRDATAMSKETDKGKRVSQLKKAVGNQVWYNGMQDTEGLGDNFYMFTDKVTESTLNIPTNSTAQDMIARLRDKRAEWSKTGVRQSLVGDNAQPKRKRNISEVNKQRGRDALAKWRKDTKERKEAIEKLGYDKEVTEKLIFQAEMQAADSPRKVQQALITYIKHNIKTGDLQKNLFNNVKNIEKNTQRTAITRLIDKVDAIVEHAEKRRAVKKFVRYANENLTEAHLSKMAPEAQEEIRKLIEHIDIAELSEKKRANLQEVEMELLQLDSRQVSEALSKPLDRLTKEQSIGGMDITQIKDLLNRVKSVVSIDKTSKLLIGLERSTSRQEALDKIDEALASFEEPADLKTFGDNWQKALRGATTALKKFDIASINLEHKVKDIDGGKKGWTWKTIYKPINDGVRYSLMIKSEAQSYMRDAIEKLGLQKEISKWAKPFGKHGLEILEHKLDSGKTIQMTRGQRISLYLLSQNKNSLLHITSETGGFAHAKENTVYKMTLNDIDTIIEKMSDKEIDLADAIHKFFNEVQKDHLNKTSMRANGYEIATEENYFPALVRNTNIDKIVDGEITLESMNQFYHSTKPGTLIERTGKAENPLILEDAFEAIARTSDMAARWCGLAIPLRDVKSVLGSKQFKESMVKHGKEIELQSMTADIKRVESTRQNAGEQIMQWVYNKYTVGRLAGNVFTVLKQMPAYTLAFTEMDFHDMQKAILHMNKDILQRKTKEEIRLHSPELDDRFSGMINREQAETLKSAQARGMFTDKKSLLEQLMSPITGADAWGVGVIWQASKNEIGRTTDLEVGSQAYWDAVDERACEVTRLTQQTSHQKDRSFMLGSDALALRPFTMFTTQLNVMYMMTRDAVMKMKRGDVSGGIYNLGVIYIVQAAMVMLVDALRRKMLYKKDKLKEDENKLLKDYLNMLVSNISIGGRLLQPIITGYDNLELPLFKVGSDIAKFSNDVKIIHESMDWKQRDAATQRAVKDAEEFMVNFGIPAKNVHDWFRTIETVATGE